MPNLRLILLAMLLLASGCTTPQLFNEAPTPSHTADAQTLFSEPAFWQADTRIVWDKVQHSSLGKLQDTLAHTSDPTAAGWLKLAIISKKYSTQPEELTQQLMLWRKDYASHAANALFPDNTALTALLNTPTPKNIALLLPLSGQLGAQGQTVRDGFLNAYYAAAKKNQQTVFFIDTNKNLTIAALYQEAIAQGADTIIGPLTKEHVLALIKQGHFPVPTLALNYTDIRFGSLPDNFYEYGLSTRDEAQQMADRAWQMGSSHAIIIAPQSDWGQRTIKPLIARWQSLGGGITDTLYYTPTTNLSPAISSLLQINTEEDRKKMQQDNNKQTLEQQRRQDFDVIFLVAQPPMARQIVPLLKYYYADNIPIIATAAIYTGSPDPEKDADLNGVYFCDIPWILKQQHKTAQPMSRLYAVGIDSYTLGNNISRLNQLPSFPIYGATGALSLTAQHQIYRRLLWTQMHAGHP